MQCGDENIYTRAHLLKAHVAIILYVYLNTAHTLICKLFNHANRFIAVVRKSRNDG